jgi:DNA repair exonuclease SbcCD ATPase subunit
MAFRTKWYAIAMENPMRIITLTLRNFRSHENTILDLDRLNFVRGPNGSGKSSIQMALEYLFTGRCQMTDAAGRGAESLIRSGEKEFEVSATLECGETISRRRTAKSQIVEINGRRVPVDAAEAFLTKQFGSADVLSAVLNADRFVGMSESEQRRFLAQSIEAGKVDIPTEIYDVLRALNEETPKLASVDDVEAAHKRFYGLRAEASRTLKALDHKEKPELPVDPPNVHEVRQKLEELRQQKERLIAQKLEADVCWQNAQLRSTHVQSEIEKAPFNALSPSQGRGPLQREPHQEPIEKLRQELADLSAEQKMVETSLAAMEEWRASCPTCGQSITEETRALRRESLFERRAELDGLIQGTNEELSEYAGIDLTPSLEEGRNAAGPHETLAVEYRPGPGDLESRMTILTERINKGERVLEKAQQFESDKERWETYARETSSLEARISLLDKLIEFFGPNGAMMGQACGRMQSFTEDLNRHLAAFGYTCQIALEPFEVRVSSSKGYPFCLSLEQLSESERFRFGVALQCALAMVTGLRIIVIDRADLLDRERRKTLTSLLVNSALDQAIVLATSEDAPPSVVPKGVQFLSLVERIKPREALASAAE